MIKREPVVGEILYSLNVGNASRNCKSELTPVTVTSVGRKYFKVAPTSRLNNERQHHLGSWRERSDYSPKSRLYFTEQEYNDEKESRILCDKLWRAFEYARNVLGLSLEELRAMAEIAFGDEE